MRAFVAIFGVTAGSLCFYEAYTTSQHPAGLILIGALNFIIAAQALTSRD